MTQDELVERLAPPRLPEEFLSVGLQDLLGAFGVGLIAALILAPFLRPFLSRRVPLADEVRARLAALAGLGRDERLLRRAELLAEYGVPLEGAERDALYRPDAEVDEAALDARIVAAARKRGR